MFSLHRAAIALVLMCWAPIVAAQSAYPTKPIHMVVPLAAGSAVDNAMRILTQRMSENMGQGIVVDNQPGAAGLIGAERVAKAAPDGYTIGGFNDSIMTMLPNLHANLSWDILKDFEPVSLVATVEWGLVTSNDSPYRSAADLIAAARGDGALRIRRRHLAHARSLQGRDPGGRRCRRRRSDGRVPGPRHRGGPCQRRKVAAHRGDDAAAAAAVCRSADGVGVRADGLRVQFLGDRARACGNPQGNRRAAQRRDRQGAGRARCT
ncbi:MAG: hypothetical protein E6H46_13675 [Betaproteobacteria bacterium]|nr:MAG: hypothetical protein E6H46_13675 [Betaproteobacteria bacterium]